MTDRQATLSGSRPRGSHPPGEIALAFQEAFTVTVRLRANRQVASDAGSFRAHIKRLLADADRTVRDAGYAEEHARLAVYAFIAFLDESVLNASQPMFSEWSRRPLQEEIFGDHMAGETFFTQLRDLLKRQDSPELADTLEVYELCLLLGFRGRFGSDQAGELRSLASAIREKIDRVRGGRRPLSPRWRPPEDEEVPVTRDPWLRRLGLAGAAVAAVVIVLFIAYTVALRPGIGSVAELAARIAP